MKPLSATEAVAAIEAGTLTAEKLVRDCLDRIAEREPVVKAWAFLDPDLAIAQARAADAIREGVLRGVPIGVKDIIDTHDMPTGHNSPIFEGKVPFGDAACVALLPDRQRRDHGQDGDDGIRQPPSRPDHQSAQSRPHAGRLVVGLGRRGGRRPCAARLRHPDRRLGDPAGGLLRRDRLQADLRRLLARRHQDAVPFARHARPDGAHARRHRPVPRRRAQAAAGRDRPRRSPARASASAARRSGTRPRPTPRRCSKPRPRRSPTRARRWSTSPSRRPSPTSSTITAPSRPGKARATTPTSDCAIPTR